MSVTTERTTGSRTRSRAGAYVPVLAFGLAALGVNALWPVPLWIVGLYAIASVLCFVLYAIDKSAAKSGRRRVPERTLLILGVLGGWPGAIIAQQTLRHKTVKRSFRRAFWATVVVNVAGFALLTTPVVEMITARD